MSKTNINIRMDEEIKKQAQAIFSELGMDTTTAINIFLRQVVREHGLPFDVKLNVPNAMTMQAIAESEEFLQNPTAPKFATVDALFEDLENDAL